MPHQNLQSLLKAMHGVWYVVDRDLRITLTSAMRDPLQWDPWPTPASGREIGGRNILDFISDPQTRAVYQQFCDQVLNGAKDEISFIYRGDTPGARRKVRMFIRPLIENGEIIGAVFHNVEQSVSERPSIDLPRDDAAGDADRQPLVVCSFCKRVRVPDHPRLSDWVSAEEYYRRGGASSVALSHGICDQCVDEIVTPNGVRIDRPPRTP